MKHFTLHLKNSLLACCIAFGFNMHGQLIVNSAVTGTQLANEIVGAGVTISNVNLQTAANGCGIFSNGGTTNIGLGNGILLTTGLASEAIGPNNVENKTSNVSNFTDDPDLDNITPYSIEDQAILSFDFVAESDFINVQYTFASEEYNEWVCSQFNDLFAFFVSGPNPGGGNYSSQNVALIPSTILPVSINTINNGTIGSSGNAGSCVSLDHEDLYVDNAGGTTIQYDGFTIVLTSQIAIVPGATYTFKFAIADISDGAYDSGVFIKANSFSIYTCDAGILSHDGAVPNLCSNDAGADNIYVITNSVTPGDTYKFILTNPAGVILAINDTGIFNLASFGVGAFLVYGISYDGTITGLDVGNNISVIGAEAEEGCFDLSPPMTFLRQPCCDLVVDAGPDLTICGNVNLTLTADVTGAEECEEQGYSDCTHAVIATTGFAENSSAAGICNDNAGVKLFTLDDTPNNVSTITLDFGSLLPIGTEVCVRVKKEHCNNTPSGTTQSDAKVQVSPTNAADYVTLVNSLLFTHTVYQSYCYTLTAPARYVKITDNAKCAFRVDYVNITTPNVSSSDLQYVWVGPGIVGLSNGPSVLVNQPGTYTVTVTDCGDCTSGDEVVITNDNTPPVFGDQQHDYNVDCTDEIPYIQPTATDNNGNVTYSYLDDTDCPLTEEECDFLTYTQGGWGAPASGGNPGVYRDANFAAAFPGGLVIGCEPGNTLSLSNASDVEGFIPSGSTASVLGTDFVNPGGGYNNVLAGQLVAATLSTTFDAYDPNFAAATGWLGNQVIGSGTFAGMTIAQLLDVANDVIGGCSNAYAPDQLNAALTALNENFDNGGNQGYILCGEIAPNCDCTVTRVWTAEDDCGNEATFTQTFHFGDDEFPVFTYCPAGVDLGCNPTGLPSPYNAIATDNCGTPTMTTYWDPEVVIGCVHYRNLIYVATDACDNNATCTQTFSWKVDTTDPVVEACPATATYKCFADVLGPADVKFDDNCDGELIPTYTQTSTNGSSSCNNIITRTWTAVDGCGNDASCVQIIYVHDDILPSFTYCPVGANLGCNPTAFPGPGNAIATDNCGAVGVTSALGPITEDGCNRSQTRTYTACDGCNNLAFCYQIFTWKVDTTDPLIESCPDNASYICFSDVPSPADVNFFDNCDGELIPTYTQTSTNGSSSCNNIITRTWTAVDGCGNDASCVQIIYVNDDINPEITTCPQGGDLGCNPAGIPEPGVAIATDNCGNPTIQVLPGDIVADGCYRSYTRTYKAIDACGNYDVCYQIFTWKVDTTNPIVESCPATATYKCFADVPGPADVKFDDNCDGELIPTYTQTSTNGSSSCNNIITRTWTAVDGCGNDASCVQIIYVNDDINPTAIYDGQLEFWVECNEELPEIEVTFDDNCDETLVTLSYEEVENENGDCSYDVVRTYYTYDDCNNYGFINITFHVADNTDPFIVSSSDPEIWVECGDAVPPSQVIFDDYCDDDLFIDYFTYNDNYTECGYDAIEIYTAYDDCGNYKVFTRVAHIQDTQAPYIVSSPEPVIYVSCEDDVPALVVEFADACDNDLEQFPISGISPYGCSFVIYRSVTAVDDCGYEITFSQTVYIIDEVAPIIVCPDDAFVGCNQLIPEPDTDDVYAYDTCGDVVVTWEGDVVGDSVCVNRYIIERTYKATDACGNSATCVQFIGVFDSEGPSLSELPEPVISCSYEGDPILPLFTDACGGQYEVTYYDEPQGGQSNDCTQAIVRYWIATDDCGNETIVPQAMFITDNYDPIVIAELNDTNVECIGDLPTEVPTFDDDCDVSLTIDADTSYIELQGCAYIVHIVWTATDECGNSVSADRDITIQDTTAPYIVENSAEELWIDCDEDQPAAVIVFDDNCDDELELFGISGLNNVTDCSYDIEQTYFATDNCGNQASWSRVIHVSDMNDPYIVSAPEEFTTLECGDIYPEAEVIFADTCDTDLETYYNWYVGENNDCYYDIVEEWWAYDNCQNMAYFTRTVRFVDTTEPIIYCPDSYTVSCASEVDEPSIDDVSAYDVCSGFNVIVAWVEDVITDSTCVNRYTVERKFSATDICGNVGYCIQYIYVYDNIAPDFTYVPESSANCNEIIDFGMAEAVDNCDEPVVITFEDEEDTDNGGEGCYSEVTRTWYATDACGNQSNAVQVVIVSDQYDPYVIYEPADYEVQCFDEVYADTATFGDNCDLNLTVLPLSSISEDNCILYIHRTWTATDDCGNSITVDQDIIVHDTIAPYVLDTPEEEIWVQCFSDVPVFDPAFGDNCDDDLTYSAISAIALNGCEQLISRSKIATDDCGNTASIGQLVHVLDTTDPTVEDNLEDFEVECDAVIPVAVAPVFDDNCDEDLTIEYDSTITYLDCGYTITRVWTAYDDCENSVSANQLVTIVDNEAPTLYPFQPFYVVECDDLWEFPAVSGYDNCSDVTVTYDQDTLSGGCFGYYIRYYHVSDDCGNTTDAEVIIQVIDTTDPTIENPADEVVSCENAPTEIPDVNYYDNCGYPVELLEATQTIVELEGCSYQIVWHWEVEDYCGNIGEATTTITVVDWTAPVLVNVPESTSYECDEIWSVVPPTADDLCHSAWVITEIDTIEGLCANENTYIYTFYAMDECGNVSEPQFTSIYVSDNTNPWFNGDLIDEEYQCLEWGNYVAQNVTASDNCGEATVYSYINPISEDDCGNGVWEVIYIATDECGLMTSASYFITVNDDTDPILENCPEDIEIECDDEIPAPVVLTAYDNCDDDVDVNLVETFEGVLIPVPGATATCRILTPVRPANNPCRYTTNWAMGLFGLPLAHRFYTVHNGAFVQYPDGTVTVTATFKSTSNQNNGWTATVSFNNAMDWATWSTQTFPTNFKADCGGVAANHQDWTYYRLLNTPGAELLGFGAYTGSSLSLVHAPSNNYFGFQLGDGANSYNSTYGFGGWFSYSGTFKINNVPYGNAAGTISGAGDFAFELDCCLDYEITRTWTATDCSGNTSSCVQTITVGDGPLLAPEAPAGTTLSEIASLRVNPNPTSGTTWFTFTTRESAKTTLELFDMAGKKVADLFAGELEAGTQYSVDYNAELLSTGIYLYRLTNGNSLEQGKLIVNK